MWKKIWQVIRQKSPEKKIKYISYFGFADALTTDPLYQEAFAVAKFLAEKDYVTVNGGGPGVMKAVSRGAKAAGGKVIGVTFYPQDITNFEGRDPQNPLDKEIKTHNYLERTLKLLEVGDLYLVFRGGTGTISEFGMAWGLARLYFGHHKPLILYGDFWHKIIKAFRQNMRIRPQEREVYRIVNSPQEAYEVIGTFEELLAQRKYPHRQERAFQL
jgi:uncharacterized protein (TIGR00725 family)